MKKIIILTLFFVLTASEISYADQASFFYSRAQQRINNYNYQGAIEDLTKATYILPENPDLYFLRATAYEKLGNLRGAIADYKIAQKFYKEQNKAQSYNAVTVTIVRLSEQLAPEETASKEDEPTTKDYMTQAKIDFKNKDYNSAIEKITKASELEPDNPAIYKARAMAKANLKDYNGALVDLHKAKVLYKEQVNFEEFEKILELISKIEANR